jgi:cell division protein FtsW
MGQPATVEPWRKPKSRQSKTRQQPLRLGVDVPFVLVTITLVVLGLIMVYSASYGISFYVSEDQSPNFMFIRQLIWLGVGLVLMGVAVYLNYQKWQKLAVLGMFVTVIALVGVLLFGDPGGEPSRNFFGGSYQPSELAKLMIVIYLSVWMYAKRNDLSDIHFGLIPLAAILGLVGGLIFSQPDISAAATVFILGGIMFFIAGGDWWQILLLVLVALLFGYFVIQINPTGSERMTSFIQGLRDPLASSDHVQRALSAFANGGWFGVGLGQGTIKLTILPVPHTDSIFAVVGEEFGVLGCAVVVVLFGIFLWRGLVIAHRAPDGLGTMLAGGITIWIALEAYLNMLAVTGLMPFAGNVLPFFSIGGSSLVFSLVGVGILLNISRLSEKVKLEQERRTFDALIDLRGRNGRRRVSRAGRSRSAKRRTS